LLQVLRSRYKSLDEYIRVADTETLRLDEETASKANEVGFDPEELARDYNNVAESLPVFCVSSRAYQQMKGNFADDTPIAGFPTLKDTGIPGLQEHARNANVGARTATCKQVLKDFALFSDSLFVWATGGDGGPLIQLTDAEKAREIDQFEDLVGGLKQVCIGQYYLV
jgi:hypothetical protein